MSAPLMITSNFSQTFGSSSLPVLEELFYAELALHPEVYTQIMQTLSHDREIWQSSDRHDLPQFRTMAEGEDYTFERSKQGGSKTLSVSKYGLGVSISLEMVEDSRFSEISSLVKGLASSGRESMNILAINLFNNGIAGTETTSDGVAAFSASHTLPSGGTFRNLLSTAADLDITSLTQAITDFDTVFVTDNGKILKMEPKYLLVHPSNKLIARELLGSTLRPDTADNNLNPVQAEGIVAVVSPHITDTDSWALLAAPRETGFRVVNRKPLQTSMSSDQGFKNDAMIYKASFRAAFGIVHPYGILGSAGA